MVEKPVEQKVKLSKIGPREDQPRKQFEMCIRDRDSVAAAFPDLSSVMETARQTLDGFNNFFGLNIANSPWYSAKQYLGEHNYLFLLAAIAIPVLAGLTQWMSCLLYTSYFIKLT